MTTNSLICRHCGVELVRTNGPRVWINRRTGTMFERVDRAGCQQNPDGHEPAAVEPDPIGDVLGELNSLIGRLGRRAEQATYSAQHPPAGDAPSTSHAPRANGEAEGFRQAAVELRLTLDKIRAELGR